MKLVIGNKNYSSWSLRAWIILKKLGLQFEEAVVALDVPGFKERLLKYSAAAKVPVLIENSMTIWDSLAILEYLAEANPKLWPQDKKLRAHARSVSHEMHSSFSALRNEMPMNCRGKNRQVKASSACLDDIARIQQIWAECREAYSEYGPWLFGEYSIADAMYLPVASRFETYGIRSDSVAAEYQRVSLADSDYQQWLNAAKAETEVIEAAELGI
jgi:glutathione S-transferase